MIAELCQFLLKLSPMAAFRLRLRPDRRVRLGFYGYHYRRPRYAMSRTVIAALLFTTLAAAAAALAASG